MLATRELMCNHLLTSIEFFFYYRSRRVPSTVWLQHSSKYQEIHTGWEQHERE